MQGSFKQFWNFLDNNWFIRHSKEISEDEFLSINIKFHNAFFGQSSNKLWWNSD